MHLKKQISCDLLIRSSKSLSRTIAKVKAETNQAIQKPFYPALDDKNMIVVEW